MPSLYKSPGVHIEPAGARYVPLEAAETGVTAFLGVTAQGPRQQPVRVGSFEQFEKVFGDDQGFFSAGVRGFFENGGRTAYIVNVEPEGGLDATPDDYIGAMGAEWRGPRPPGGGRPGAPPPPPPPMSPGRQGAGVSPPPARPPAARPPRGAAC